MSKLRIGPINAATPTPLTSTGDFDEASMPRLVNRWLDLALDGVLLLGSMGEGLVVSDATRNAYVEAAIAQAKGKLTLFANVADYSRARMAERARRYAHMGADCIVICLPPGASPAKAIADVKAVADASPIPCAYYDSPFNTGVNLVLSDMLDILRHDNIVAMKDSSGNPLIAQALTHPDYRPAGVTILHGNEYGAAQTALLGYDGVLHGGGVLTGKRVRQIFELVAAGKIAEAMTIDRANAVMLARIYNRFDRPLQNVAGQKHALKLLGVLDSDFAVEQSLGDADRARVARVVDEFRTALSA